MLPERNAHCGGQLMRALEEYGVKVLLGHDNKPGWNTSTASKTQAHDSYATMLREAARVGTAILHDPRVYLQLSSIDRNSLCAPGKRQGARAVDDESTAEILADMARSLDSFEYRGAFGPEDVLSAGLGQRLQRRTLDPKEEEKEAAAALWLGLDDFLGL